jgi:hypothetical protein
VTNECNEDRPPSYSELFPPTSQENWWWKQGK